MGIVVVDLFAGAGGASEGACDALKALGLYEDATLYGVNCWQEAIDIYKLNHPKATVMCQRVEQVIPEQLVPGGRVNLLIAGPECVHHSVARGGRPIDDQRRVPAWTVVNWLHRVVVDKVIIENVPEFVSWAPLGVDNKPLKSKKGEIFKQYLEAIRSCGYEVDYRVLCCADYGDFTSRRRLFIQATRKGKIGWPKISYASRKKLAQGQSSLFETALQPYRAAREIIDWENKGQNIFDRAKPLAIKTMTRIGVGMKDINGIDITPFIVKLYGTSHTASVDEPLPTVTASGQHLGLANPFVLSQASGGAPRPVEEPLPTICAAGAEALIEPFIVPNFGERPNQTPRRHSVDDPLPTATSHGAGGLVEPFIVGQFSGSRARSVDAPLPALTTTSRGVRLIEPFLVSAGGPEGKGRQPHNVDEPLSTVMTENHEAIVDPFLVVVNHGDQGAVTPSARWDSVEEPLGTVTCKNGRGLVEPLIVKYYGTGVHQPVSEPLDTVTTKQRFGLVDPYLVNVGGRNLVALGDGRYLGINFRMLQDYELAAAHGFPKDYIWTTKKSINVKLVGNSWPRKTAGALCHGALLSFSQDSEAVAWVPYHPEIVPGAELSC